MRPCPDQVLAALADRTGMSKNWLKQNRLVALAWDRDEMLEYWAESWEADHPLSFRHFQELGRVQDRDARHALTTDAIERRLDGTETRELVNGFLFASKDLDGSNSASTKTGGSRMDAGSHGRLQPSCRPSPNGKDSGHPRPDSLYVTADDFLTLKERFDTLEGQLKAIGQPPRRGITGGRKRKSEAEASRRN